MSNLITWDYCKEILELDERDREIIELLIFSVSVEIELFTDRNLYEREIRELHDGYHQKEITLRHYPVKEILKLYCDRTRKYNETYLIDPQYYTLTKAEEGGKTEIQSEIILEEGYTFPRGRKAIFVTYVAGYKTEEMPENIKTAAIEMVEWNLKRIRGDQIGAKQLIRGNNERGLIQYEETMPLRVKELLNPFKRKNW